MEFEWDDAKAARNLTKHGVRFDYVSAVFMGVARVDFDATRSNDGEVRRKVVGLIEGRLYSVVYTFRQNKIRLISARRANKKEASIYGPLHFGPE